MSGLLTRGFAEALPAIARERKTVCRTCGQQARVTAAVVSPVTDGVCVDYVCHGQREGVEIAGLGWAYGDDLTEAVYERLPRAVFLTSCIRYGVVSAEARRERRMRAAPWRTWRAA